MCAASPIGGARALKEKRRKTANMKRNRWMCYTNSKKEEQRKKKKTQFEE